MALWCFGIDVARIEAMTIEFTVVTEFPDPYQAYAVDEMTLYSLPNTKLVVTAHTDHVARRVCKWQDCPVMSLDAIQTRAGIQIPNAEHTVLRPWPSAGGVVGVDDGWGVRAAVTVQGVNCQVIVKPNHSQRVILQERTYEKMIKLWSFLSEIEIMVI